MSFAVLVAELRTAAGLYEGVGADLGTTPVVIDHVDPTSLGHVELAAWLAAVADQCTKAHQALADGVTDLAVDLRTTATTYETTDDAQATRYQPYLLGSPSLPGAPASPFFPGGAYAPPPFTAPVYTPPTGD